MRITSASINTGPPPHAFFNNPGKQLIQRFVPCAFNPIRRHSDAETFGHVFNRRMGLRDLRNADRIAVILNQEQHRQLFARRPVQRLEKLAFAGGAFTGGNVNDGALAFFFRRLGRADRNQILRPGARRSRHQVQAARRKMLGHVPAIGTGIAFAAQHVKKKYLCGRHPQRIGDGFLAVVREKPVEPGLHQHHGADLNFLVTARRRVKRYLALLAEYLEALFDEVHSEHLAGTVRWRQGLGIVLGMGSLIFSGLFPTLEFLLLSLWHMRASAVE